MVDRLIDWVYTLKWRKGYCIETLLCMRKSAKVGTHPKGTGLVDGYDEIFCSHHYHKLVNE